MKYLSVCSGIEAASVAWHSLGWEPVAFSEIEPFPSAVLAHRFPGVPNLGDMTKFKEWKIERGTIGALVGGTPCQSFSVAGLRRGLEDPRGNLMLTFGAIADHLRPTWIVWENVPGVLSSNGGRDFGSFLGMLGELGYGVAYRVLDAQFFGVAQRRRRVFVVGYLGDWRRAAAVLFESESLSGNPAPSREKREGVAGSLAIRSSAGGGLGTDFDLSGGLQAVAGTLDRGVPGRGAGNAVGYADHLIPTRSMSLNAKGGSGRMDGESETLMSCAPIRTRPYADNASHETQLVTVFNARQDPDSWSDRTGPLDTDGSTQAVQAHGVRRLTPRECERLQGFPDDWTLIPWRRPMADKGLAQYGKMAPDGPRYKACGNSMAVPVMRWIGHRIEAER